MTHDASRGPNGCESQTHQAFKDITAVAIMFVMSETLRWTVCVTSMRKDSSGSPRELKIIARITMTCNAITNEVVKLGIAYKTQ